MLDAYVAGDEFAIHQARRRALLRIAPRGDDEVAAPAHAPDARQSHQARDPLTAYTRAPVTQLRVDVRATVIRVKHPDAFGQHRVFERTPRWRALFHA
jgi:hypothetical protein